MLIMHGDALGGWDAGTILDADGNVIGMFTGNLDDLANMDLSQLDSLIGAATLPGGIRVLPDGTVILPDGTRLPKGARVLADGTIIMADGTRLPPGSKILADGTIVMPDGTRILPDGTKVLANGMRVLADGTVIMPDGPFLHAACFSSFRSPLSALCGLCLTQKKEKTKWHTAGTAGGVAHLQPIATPAAAAALAAAAAVALALAGH